MASRGIGLVICFTVGLTARADTLNGALINAYQNNPQLNSQRAVVRQTDESVPQALSGYVALPADKVRGPWARWGRPSNR